MNRCTTTRGCVCHVTILVGNLFLLADIFGEEGGRSSPSLLWCRLLWATSSCPGQCWSISVLQGESVKHLGIRFRPVELSCGIFFHFSISLSSHCFVHKYSLAHLPLCYREMIPGINVPAQCICEPLSSQQGMCIQCKCLFIGNIVKW